MYARAQGIRAGCVVEREAQMVRLSCLDGHAVRAQSGGARRRRSTARGTRPHRKAFLNNVRQRQTATTLSLMTDAVSVN